MDLDRLRENKKPKAKRDASIMQISISSTGLYLPPRIQSSAELSNLIGRSEEWILSRTGVHQRRVAEERMDFLAARAALEAIGDGPRPDCIINASLTPVQLIPDSAVSFL